jgi:hypothetical protein
MIRLTRKSLARRLFQKRESTKVGRYRRPFPSTKSEAQPFLPSQRYEDPPWQLVAYK